MNRTTSPIGFFLLAAGILTGAVWLGFGELLPGANPWFPVAVAVLVVAGSACFFFSLREPQAAQLERISRNVVAALEAHRDQLERIAVAPGRLSTSLEQIDRSVELVGDGVRDLGRRLSRHGNRMEELAKLWAQAGRQTGADQEPEEDGAAAGPTGVQDDPVPSSSPDIGPLLLTAWRRYLDGGDGYFNAQGLKDQLASAKIDVDVRDLDRGPGHAVLAVEDPRSANRDFFAVPDFTKSPQAAEHWFEDRSSRSLGGRSNELRTLARGTWSDSGPVVVEKGTVA